MLLGFLKAHLKVLGSSVEFCLQPVKAIRLGEL